MDKMSHRQNVTQTKCHMDEISQEKSDTDKKSHGQYVTGEMFEAEAMNTT